MTVSFSLAIATMSPAYTSSVDSWSFPFRKYAPRPDNQGVLAAQIPHEFKVHAQWGELRGKPGDYLVKDYEHRETEYPDDVWIVDQTLFAATYDWDVEGKGV